VFEHPAVDLFWLELEVGVPASLDPGDGVPVDVLAVGEDALVSLLVTPGLCEHHAGTVAEQLHLVDGLARDVVGVSERLTQRVEGPPVSRRETDRDVPHIRGFLPILFKPAS